MMNYDGGEYHSIEVPACMPEIVGIALGGCVNGGRRFRARAHAHNDPREPYYGWVCFLAAHGLSRRNPWPHLFDGEPSGTLWHEYAHILTPKHGHDQRWAETMRRLGRVVPKQYKHLHVGSRIGV